MKDTGSLKKRCIANKQKSRSDKLAAYKRYIFTKFTLFYELVNPFPVR